MELSIDELKRLFPALEPKLIEEIEKHGILKEIPKGTEILRTGQHVQMVPIVLSGLVKVYQEFEERDLLLYYIQNSESCIMSFNSVLRNQPSKIFAITEEPTTLLLLPDLKVREWIGEFPSLSSSFFHLYDKRYDDLLDTIQQVVFHNLDDRVILYLRELSKLKNSYLLDIRHKQIANELGTSREVVSRVIKKLENKGLLQQTSKGIQLNSSW